MEWRILLAFVLLAILLGSVLSIAYKTTPAVRNLPNNTAINIRGVPISLVYSEAEAEAEAEDPYDLNAGWNGFYRDHLHAFDSSGNYL